MILRLLFDRATVLSQTILDETEHPRLERMSRRGFAAVVGALFLAGAVPTAAHESGRLRRSTCPGQCCLGGQCRGDCEPDLGAGCFDPPQMPSPPQSHCWCAGDPQNPDLVCDCENCELGCTPCECRGSGGIFCQTIPE